MLEWKWPRMSVGAEIARVLSRGIEAVTELVSGPWRTEAKVYHAHYDTVDRWPPLRRPAFAMAAPEADGAAASSSRAPRLAPDAQQRFDKLERELKEARATSRGGGVGEDLRADSQWVGIEHG